MLPAEVTEQHRDFSGRVTGRGCPVAPQDSHDNSNYNNMRGRAVLINCSAHAQKLTLCSEILMLFIPLKLFCAMITLVLRNPARHNSSEIVWRHDRMVIAHLHSWKHATETARTQRTKTKLRNRPGNNCPRVILCSRL